MRAPILAFVLLLVLAFVLLLAVTARAQQVVLLLTEDFEQPSNTFVFDTGVALPWVIAGSNQWIINNEFNGGGIYPNTTPQDSITGGTPLGTIRNAPYSTYLHIHDVNAAGSGVANANYDPTSASDRFAYTSQGFCTRGLTDVTLSFFHVCEGSSNAHGEVWFSVDGGAWQQTGASSYSNQNKWEFVVINDPAFNNVENLRFGFRWVNDAGTLPSSASFSIDEVFLVGTVDTIHPVTITITNVFPAPPDSVCLQYPFYVSVRLSQSLCTGPYRLELSNGTGNFSNPTDLGTYLLGGGTDFFLLNSVPGTFPEGNCYRVRLIRLDYPEITSSVSPCFKVSYCANTIETLQPVVVTDLDTVCSQSAIDVPFYSYGVYFGGNIYTAQLSDSAGNFEYYDTNIDTTVVIDTTVFPPDTTYIYDTTVTVRSVFQVIGTLPSRATYDPNLPPFQPGTVSGLLPRTPESCNYYIRVVASRPETIGTVYGPFCIEHCDITTNQTLDLNYCVSDNAGITDTIFVDINQWDSTAVYDPSNQFIVQLLDMMFFQVVNTGGLGVEMDSLSGTMIIVIPGRNALAALGILPGTYYMRIIATNSNTPWNLNGTLIRITIGAPKDVPSVLIPDKYEYCNTETALFLIEPYNDSSQYQIISALINNGVPVTIDAPGISLDLSGITTTQGLTLRVREINYGCLGPISPPTTVLVQTPANVNISGPDEVCKGDTFTYRVPFIPLTYYGWSVTWGRIVDTSNNEIIITFDSAGTAQINVFAVNTCGRQDGSYTVDVFSLVDVDAGDDLTICAGQTAELKAESAGLLRNLTTTQAGGFNMNGNMFDLRAKGDITVTGFDVFLPANDTMSIAIYYRPATYIGAEYDPSSWTILDIASNVPSSGAGIPTPIPISVNINIPAGQTYGFYITVTDGGNLPATTNNGTNPVYSDPFLEFHKGTGNVHAFGSIANNVVWNGVVHYTTYSGLSYLWSDGTTTAVNYVSPDSATLYSVIIKDTAGCGSRDEVFVAVNPSPTVLAAPEAETICVGKTVPLSATGADSYEWLPLEGIDNPNISNPLAMPQQSTLYIVKGIYDSTGCAGYDTSDITVIVNEPTVFEISLCDGDSYFAGGAEQTLPGTYYDTLVAVGNGCDSIIVTTLAAATEGCDLLLVIPQAFTPNNDGVNDHFTVFGDNVDTYEIRIFNRWGEQVYYSNDINEVSQGDFTLGWDGTHEGKPQDTGVFVYYIRAGKGVETPVERKGNVTLIR